eukprot:705748-Amphidinium_carterae.2
MESCSTVCDHYSCFNPSPHTLIEQMALVAGMSHVFKTITLQCRTRSILGLLLCGVGERTHGQPTCMRKSLSVANALSKGLLSECDASDDRASNSHAVKELWQVVNSLSASARTSPQDTSQKRS